MSTAGPLRPECGGRGQGVLSPAPPSRLWQRPRVAGTAGCAGRTEACGEPRGWPPASCTNLHTRRRSPCPGRCCCSGTPPRAGCPWRPGAPGLCRHKTCLGSGGDSEAAAREGALQTESSAPDGARRSGAPPGPGASRIIGRKKRSPACAPSSDRQEDRQSLPVPRARPQTSLLQTRPARPVLKVWRDSGLGQGRLCPPWCLPGPSLLGMPVGRHSAFSASEKVCQRSRDEESKASWLRNVPA